MNELNKHKENLSLLLKAKREEYAKDEGFNEIVGRQKTIVKVCEINEVLENKVQELIETIEHLGQHSNTCTKSYTGKICSTCKCKRTKYKTDIKDV